MKINDVILNAELKGFKEICFELKCENIKPVFVSQLNNTNKDFICMLDSGAGIPVWCNTIQTLLDTFPSAIRRSDMRSIISGFGNGFQIVDVYYIPQIKICNGISLITFIDFYLPIIDKRSFGTDMIFPSAMLKNSNILISQMGTGDTSKNLFVQYSTNHFKTHYTFRRLTDKGIDSLKKIFNVQNISVYTKFLGAEREFSNVLTQEGNVLNTEQCESDDDIQNNSAVKFTSFFD